jgi:hypothetical protein
MTTHWHSCVCQDASAARIVDVLSYAVPDAASSVSPIDRFYILSRDILKAAHPDLLKAHPTTGPLFLVGLISATENYFRDVLARVIRVCPIAQMESSDEMIRLGSVVWHGGIEVERGAFEHIAFTAAKNIFTTCLKFLGYQLKAKGGAMVMLEEFEKVCELRHAIVHSGTLMTGKNALRLDIARQATPLRVQVDYAKLQECGAICNSLVVAVNIELFQELAKRWATSWRDKPSWVPANEEKRFKEVWDIFHSETDATEGQISKPLSMDDCRKAVLTEFVP